MVYHTLPSFMACLCFCSAALVREGCEFSGVPYFTFFLGLYLFLPRYCGYRGMWVQWCTILYLLLWPVFVSVPLLWLERGVSSVVYHTLPSFMACTCFCPVTVVIEGCEFSGVPYFTFFHGLSLFLFCCSGWRGMWVQWCIIFYLLSWPVFVSVPLLWLERDVSSVGVPYFTFFPGLYLFLPHYCSYWGMWVQWCTILYLLSWPVFVSVLLLWLERGVSSVVYHTLPSFLVCTCFCPITVVIEGCEFSGVSYFTFFLGLYLFLPRYCNYRGMWVQWCTILYLLLWPVFVSVPLLWLERDVSSVVYHTLPSFMACTCFCPVTVVIERCEFSGVPYFTFFYGLSLFLFCCSGWRGMWVQWCIIFYLLSWPVFVSVPLLWLERDVSSVVYHILPSFMACLCFCSAALVWEGCEFSGVSYFTFFHGLSLFLFRCSGWRGLWAQWCFDEGMFHQFMRRPSVSLVFQQTSGKNESQVNVHQLTSCAPCFVWDVVRTSVLMTAILWRLTKHHFSCVQ